MIVPTEVKRTALVVLIGFALMCLFAWLLITASGDGYVFAEEHDDRRVKSAEQGELLKAERQSKAVHEAMDKLIAEAKAGIAAASPRSRIGIYLLVGQQAPDNPANRYVRSPNPKALPWQRGQGVRRNYAEVFSKTIEPCVNWIEAAPATPGVTERPHPKIIAVDFERTFGSDETYAGDKMTGRVLGFQEELISRQYGLKHLTSRAFAEAAEPYVAAGIEVVAHSGSPNTTDPRGDRWADEQVAAGRGHVLFQELVTTDVPLLAAGVRVGRDGMQLATADSLNWRYYQFYKSLGGLQQIEATPGLNQSHLPKDEVYRLRASLFWDRHVTAKIPGFAKVGSPEFNALKDVRVSIIPSDLGADQMDSDPGAGKVRWQRLVDTLRPQVRKVLQDCPNLTIELHHSIIERAIDLGVKASDWVP